MYDVVYIYAKAVADSHNNFTTFTTTPANNTIWDEPSSHYSMQINIYNIR